MTSDELVRKYPEFFPKGGYAGCSDGWIDILDTLLSKIRVLVTDGNATQPKVLQIKEKFGGLRFYYDFSEEEYTGADLVDKLVREAEKTASKTCEFCGKPGSLRSGGWLKTLCDEHNSEREKRYASINRP